MNKDRIINIDWKNAKEIPQKKFVCGYCGTDISSQKGFEGTTEANYTYNANIYICHHCDKPTFVDWDGTQTPAPIYGNEINHLPEEIEKLFNEARTCYTVKAYTSCAICCRKILMNVAVKEGAEEDKTFVFYVNYLDTKNFIPAKGKQWVDEIRLIGNGANHKIEFISQEKAELVLIFTTNLLRTNYEMGGMLEKK